MSIRLRHEFTVAVDVRTAWNLLLDLERVASCFPGATLIESGDDFCEGTVKVRLGAISMTYRGEARFVSKDATQHVAVMNAQGGETSGAGNAGAEVQLTMSPDGPTGTLVTVDTDLTISGRAAQFGRGMIAEVSEGILQRFTSNLERQVLGEYPAGALAAPEPPVDLTSLALRPVLLRAVPMAIGLMLVSALLLRRCRSRRAGHRSASVSIGS